MSARAKAFLALAAMALLLVLFRLLPVQDWLQGFTTWVGSAGW